MCYHTSESERYHEDLTGWVAKNKDDRAFVNFIPSLKDHLLACLTGQLFNGDDYTFSNAERDQVAFANNRIYHHKVIRINYTTYDMHRAQDSVNLCTHADIVVLAREDGTTGVDEHLFWYACIVGIYHVNVRHLSSSSKSREPQCMDFLWGPDIPFGFVSPDEVLRETHFIPAFAHGKTSELLPQSIAHQESEQNEDWKYHYVNIFVDRDMFMHYLGGGVGHKGAGTSQYRMHKENEHCNGQDRGDEDGEGQSEYANEEEEGDEVNVDDEDEEDTDGENDDRKEEEEEEEEDDDDDDEVGEEEGDEEDNIVDLGPEDGEDGNIEDEYGVDGFAPL
ncbi:hypothetical protein SCP_0800380 [Sparassis crispa]|uniref:Uncharacterized protein n=1 Tax=Sparassis crispa TaxID=139825 RepID=A0A401GTG7_9APHY|nr:hypothetical protein SCP_0800380 [Sparassis crispa]GBE85521.1 hypothetical protein SCP_0800380 [Sparassis crispa]